MISERSQGFILMADGSWLCLHHLRQSSHHAAGRSQSGQPRVRFPTVPVYLLVNKEILGPQTLTMAPYSTCEAVFEADMSQPSEQYILTAFTALEGDEEISNDTVTTTVTCRGPVNPYQMDFEYCADFAKGGFNPA